MESFLFRYFFFVPGYNFSLFNRVSNQSLPMFCVFHGIETRPMLLLTPYKSNKMLRNNMLYRCTPDYMSVETKLLSVNI